MAKLQSRMAALGRFNLSRALARLATTSAECGFSLQSGKRMYQVNETCASHLDAQHIGHLRINTVYIRDGNTVLLESQIEMAVTGSDITCFFALG